MSVELEQACRQQLAGTVNNVVLGAVMLTVSYRKLRVRNAARRLSIGTGAFVMAIAIQSTAGAEQPSRFDWSGIYFGVHVGGQKLKSNHVHNYTGPIAGTISSASANFGDTGAIGGGQIGFNWQASRYLVLGIEADMSAASHDNGGVVLQNPLVATEHYDGASRLGTQGSVRGRIGFTGSPWLIYVTGGVAFGRAEVSTTITDNAVGSRSFSNSKLLTGWTLGSGLEYLIFSNWLFGVEYRYTDLGSLSITTPNLNFPTDVLPYTATANFRAHDVRVRLSYKFGMPGVANR